MDREYGNSDFGRSTLRSGFGDTGQKPELIH